MIGRWLRCPTLPEQQLFIHEEHVAVCRPSTTPFCFIIYSSPSLRRWPLPSNAVVGEQTCHRADHKRASPPCPTQTSRYSRGSRGRSCRCNQHRWKLWDCIDGGPLLSLWQDTVKTPEKKNNLRVTYQPEKTQIHVWYSIIEFCIRMQPTGFIIVLLDFGYHIPFE